MLTTQLNLFNGVNVAVVEPEPMTQVKVGSRIAQIPLRRKRREACDRLLEILDTLEGKDIYIGSYDVGGRHYWIDNLLLRRLKLEWYPPGRGTKGYIPSVIVLWGNRSASVRIFTDYLVAVREQEYMGYWHWLLDFRNGYYNTRLDEFKSHYACLHITRFKD